jgi:D-alanyl-D-alanine endopeptidase (penicillin-binding protein 7)
MANTHFVNANGLTTENVSTAFDLVKLLQAAYQYPLIRVFCTDRDYTVRIGKHTLHFVNSDRLVRSSGWDIEIQKTGFINESGHCLVMRANVDGRELIMVFLDGSGKLTRFADAQRVRKQLAQLQKK